MPGLNTPHDVSGHRYGKGELPIGSLASAARKAFLAGRDKKRKELEKNKPKDDDKTTDKEPEPPKKPTAQFIAGPTLAKRPGAMPAPTVRGTGGKMQSNPEYGKWKHTATDFKAHQTEQLVIQNHSAHQFQNFVAPRIPGAPIPATGYEPTNSRTGGFNKAKMGTIQKAANNIEALSAHNRELQSRRPQPPAAGSTPPSTGEAPKTISES
jgi:hypothetical protein